MKFKTSVAQSGGGEKLFRLPAPPCFDVPQAFIRHATVTSIPSLFFTYLKENDLIQRSYSLEITCIMPEPYSLSLQLPIDRTAPSRPEDVFSIKETLRRLGLYHPPKYEITGITDEGMFDGILNFQKNEGLVEDGVMKPAGPARPAARATAASTGPRSA